jgi:predicted metallo-beta-lactamase superfamily hydrolase
MKRLLFITLLLTGCSTVVPVKQEFPSVPDELKSACQNLKQIEPTTKLSDVVSVVTYNYSLYQECQLKSQQWIEWYDNQNSIFKSVK